MLDRCFDAFEDELKDPSGAEPVTSPQTLEPWHCGAGETAFGAGRVPWEIREQVAASSAARKVRIDPSARAGESHRGSALGAIGAFGESAKVVSTMPT